MINVDAVVIGAGVAGLMLTKKLASIGFAVLLSDSSTQLANGPSTKNEGWLHRGTYHATSIRSRKAAIQVARRCIYGHEQIKLYAPEAVEDVSLPSYAIIRDVSKLEEIISRWDEAGVSYKPVSIDAFLNVVPEVSPYIIGSVFEVNDVGINTRLLYKKLLSDSRRLGAIVVPGSHISFNGGSKVVLHTNTGEAQDIHSSIFLYTAGYGIKQIFKSQFDLDVPMRYWKSHLLVVPRLSTCSVFCLDPGESAMMNHGDHSVVGMNEDAILCDAPSFEPEPDKVESALQALRRMFNGIEDLDYLAVACTKVDMVEKVDFARSLNVSISEPIENHICIIPGKMSEAPYVTDVVAQMVYNRIGDTEIALRPSDVWINMQEER